MAFREVSVNEIREVLRVWLGVAGLPAPGYRTIAAHCGLDRKTVRRWRSILQVTRLRDLNILPELYVGCANGQNMRAGGPGPLGLSGMA